MSILPPRAAFSAAAALALSVVPLASAQRQESIDARVDVVLDGVVRASDGAPVEGAVVVSSAGGRALTGPAGEYRLSVAVPMEATRLEVTAAGGAGGKRVARASVELADAHGRARGALAVDPLRLVAGAACAPDWYATFGAQPGANADVRALVSYDDGGGGGAALYAGGSFTSAGDASASFLARWDGSQWSALGSGVNGTVRALLVHDSGSGPELYVGGDFTVAGGLTANRIAKWDGSAWSTLGTGMNAAVRALAVYDSGAGARVHAAGAFTDAGGAAANAVAAWNGASWEALGAGTFGVVNALASFGGELYAGGTFTAAGGAPASRIASWDGSAWSPLGSGVSLNVNALLVHDDGSGAQLWVGGFFLIAGGLTVNHVARWSGSAWSQVVNGTEGPIHSFARFPEVGGDLYASGNFLWAGDVDAHGVARWGGSEWSTVGAGIDGAVLSLEVHAGELWAGGTFDVAAVAPAGNVARLDAVDGWSPTGAGLDGPVAALAIHDDGGGAELVVAGTFRSAGGSQHLGEARFDGAWSPLPQGGNAGPVTALATYDDGGGLDLYASFGETTSELLRWDGASWTSLGSAPGQFGLPGVLALAVYDRGSGPELYAAGTFQTIGATSSRCIARWSGSGWFEVADGPLDGLVEALEVHDDGSGPALYVGGTFTVVGATPASRIARWDGAWSALGAGVNGPVRALAVFDAGGGPELYAGGSFTVAGGAGAPRIARWDGTGWSSAGAMNGTVRALEVFDDGGGAALYAGGAFTVASGVAANRIARWDGASWGALGGGASGEVVALHALGRSLFAGGGFAATDAGDSYLARYGCEDVLAPLLEHPESVTVTDSFPDGPGEVVLFTVTASDDHDPAPAVVCVPPSGSTFPPGTTLVQCAATDAAGNESTSAFPVTVRVKARSRSL